jgi:hypothetical protein
MKAVVKEATARTGRRPGKRDGERAVLATIAAMPTPERAMGERLQALIEASAPSLSPKLWYGMPAYAKDGKVVCFFRSAQRFKERYMTFGFNDEAKLDDGGAWPIYFAVKELTSADETRIGALVKKAVGGGRSRVAFLERLPGRLFRSGTSVVLIEHHGAVAAGPGGTRHVPVTAG